MREIKFRGKGVNGAWLFGNLQVPKPPFDKYFMWNKIGIQREVIPETVGQFTGLHDKNRKEIYEGDIVEHEYLGKGEIKWDTVQTGFYVYIDASDEGCLHMTNPDEGTMELEVIGNIHEDEL